ncbi:MAG: hypothetical protein ABFE07_28040 [Armatimonadia bacterium]
MNDLNQPLTFKPEITKVANYEMPMDTNVWDEEVLKHLHEEHPELTEENFEVVFKKTDAKKGYGYGFVALGKEGAVKIPIIIKEYQMYPLDVMIYEKQAAPLTPETVKEIVSSTELGRVAPKPEEPFAYVGPNITERVYPGLYSVFRPGLGGRVSSYKYAAALGIGEDELNELTVRLGGRQYASLLTEIGVSAEQAKSFRERLEKDASAVLAWVNSPMQPILKKAAVASRPPENNPDAVPPGQAHPLVDALIVRPEPAKGWGPIERHGRYVVQGTSGLDYEGEVFPTVLDFDLQKQNLQIFCGGMLIQGDTAKGQAVATKPYRQGFFSAVQPAIAGKSAEGDKGCPVGEAAGCYARANDTGFFYIAKGKAALAFVPVKVLNRSSLMENRQTSMREDSGQVVNTTRSFEIVKLRVQDAFGRTYNVVISPQASNVQHVGDLVLMPAETKFRNLSNEIIKLKGDAPAEAAPQVKTAVLRNLGADSFAVEADWATAWAREGDRREKIAAYLGEFYTKESLEKAFAAAKPGERLAIAPRAELAKTAASKYEGAERIARDLTKIAAALPDPALVDTVLSLQFINKDNVNKFISFLPHFEKAASHLADLLIASRIGLGVEEYPIKAAMENVMEVISDLRMLRGQ